MAADLTFKIGADLAEIKAALASLKGDFTKIGQQAQQAGGRGAFSGVESGAKSALGAVGRLVAGLASVAGAIALISKADELNTLNARLRLVTNSAEEFLRVQQALFDLSQRTRSSLTETAALYARIAQATKDAKVGQETLLQVVETINQAVQLSGASSQAAEAALIQLGQGLASGTLRGEELNSILEQTPALADAIAKGMGITRGELRKYGEEGKLSAQAVLGALLQQRDEIAQQFSQLPLTVGQSVTLLRNAGLQLLGTFDQTRGATAGLAKVIKDLADFLSSDEVIGAVVEFSATWSDAFAQIVADTNDAVRIIRGATTDIIGSGEDLIQILGRAFRELPVNIRASIQIVTVQAAAMFDRLVSYARFVKDNFTAIFSSDTQDAAFERFQARNRAIADATQASIDDALDQREKALADARAVREAADEVRRIARRPRADGFGRGTFKKTLSDQERSARKAELDAQEKLLQDSSRRELSILQEFYEDARVAAEDYFARRQALELKAVEDSIALKRRELALAKDSGERAKVLADIEILERSKADITRKAERERVRAARDTGREIADAQAQSLEQQGRLEEAARIRLNAQFADTLNRLKADGNEAGAAIIQGLINTGVAKAKLDELQNLFETRATSLQSRLAEIADRQATGQITPGQARDQAAQERQKALADMQVMADRLREMASAPDALPGVKAAAEAAAAALRRMAIDSATGVEAAMIDLRKALADLEANLARTATNAGVEGLTTFFTDLVSGSKSAGDALRDFVRGFAQSMAQIAARALATFLVLQGLDLIYPGLGRATAATLGAGVNHSGGMAGTGQKRQVPAALFAGAPRYHSGGMVGIKPDERPAILQTGEEVLSRSDPRNRANGGAGNGYRIVNVLDPALVSNYLESAAGERTVLNVIGRNPGHVKQLIGA